VGPIEAHDRKLDDWSGAKAVPPCRLAPGPGFSPFQASGFLAVLRGAESAVERLDNLGLGNDTRSPLGLGRLALTEVIEATAGQSANDFDTKGT
jgi:hypothetical protein